MKIYLPGEVHTDSGAATMAISNPTALATIMLMESDRELLKSGAVDEGLAVTGA